MKLVTPAVATSAEFSNRAGWLVTGGWVNGNMAKPSTRRDDETIEVLFAQIKGQEKGFDGEMAITFLVPVQL